VCAGGGVQRGAASFVAQLRDTKENSDVLVSLILTKEMLLVARKPRPARALHANAHLNPKP
jgi:hypothetical protein